MNDETTNTSPENTTKGNGAGFAKTTAVLEILNGSIFVIFAIYGLIAKPAPDYLVPSIIMTLIGILFIVVGVFLFKLKKWAWIFSLVFYGGGLIYLSAYTLVEHFGHGMDMSFAFQPGIIPFALITGLIIFSRKAVFIGREMAETIH